MLTGRRLWLLSKKASRREEPLGRKRFVLLSLPLDHPDPCVLQAQGQCVSENQHIWSGREPHQEKQLYCHIGTLRSCRPHGMCCSDYICHCSLTCCDASTLWLYLTVTVQHIGTTSITSLLRSASERAVGPIIKRELLGELVDLCTWFSSFHLSTGHSRHFSAVIKRLTAVQHLLKVRWAASCRSWWMIISAMPRNCFYSQSHSLKAIEFLWFVFRLNIYRAQIIINGCA